METTIAGFQSTVSAELAHVQETLSTDRKGMQAELADARSVSARAAAALDQALLKVNKDIAAIKERQAMVIERLNIERVVAVVRDWQTAHVPQTEAALKKVQEKDHDEVKALSKQTTAIRGHFKMFHAIAS